MDNTYIVIPARKGSKGLPGKNRILLKHTLDIIPKKYIQNVYVTTDDPEIIEQCKERNIKYVMRPSKYATDEASTHSVMTHFIKTIGLLKTDKIIMLYLTYPDRTWDDVVDAYKFIDKYNAQSLLCSKTIQSAHPYLHLLKDGINGKQLKKHDLYRRQDYPEMFEISHYICIFKAREITKLNNNMYNDKTVYYSISNVVDVDTPKDLNMFNNNNNNNIDKSDLYNITGTKKVIVFGNDKTLTDIKLSDIPKDFETIGINRSWLHIKTDYLFFNDIIILIELIRAGKTETDLKNMNIIASDWLIETSKQNNQFHIIKPYLRKNIIRIYDRIDKLQFPDAATTAIEIFNKYIYHSMDINYFLYATSLKYDDNDNHFWTHTFNTINKYTKTWYETSFANTLYNFKLLQTKKYKIYSVSKQSKLNDIFTNIPINKINKIILSQEKQELQELQEPHNIIKSDNINGITKMSLSEFKEYIKGKTICAVANSTDILNTKLGTFIDSHDIVIRFNSYKLNTLDTGTKIDIHVTVWLQEFNIKNPVHIRFVFSGGKDNWINFIKTKLDPNKQDYILDSHWPIFDNMIDQSEKIIPTSGFNTLRIIHSLGGYQKFNLIGFTFYNKINDVYRDNACYTTISKVHNYPYEKQWVLDNALDIDTCKNIISI